MKLMPNDQVPLPLDTEVKTTSRFIPFSPPTIGEEEIAEVVDTLRSDWITTGPKVKRFEDAFRTFVGAPAALAVSSGTDAMLIALATLSIGPGDAVLTTPMTFCSTVHVIEHLGAQPVLVDVEPDTLNIDPDHVEAALTRLTKDATAQRGSAEPIGKPRVLLPVHLYGHPCAIDSLFDLAQQYGLAVVEDAAHALGARIRERTIGSVPPSPTNTNHPVTTLTAFSFYATKNLTTAEGGMLTGPADVIETARMWSLHGMSRDAYVRYSAEGSWYYEVLVPGFKCNMTDLQAALGLQQLKKLPYFQERRREIAGRYTRAFQQLEELETPTVRPNVDHAWHLYVLRLNVDRLRIDRAQFIEELKRRNIGASVHFIPVHLHRYYRSKYGYKPEDFPVAYREYQRLVSLPLYPKMTDADVDVVIEAVYDIVARFRR
jgi:dTDP-4-amino-4,6-dideoxygalactose transaminase